MEILTNLQKRILLCFSELPDQEAFYLTGGTALSTFFLKHRRSNDLDFFTNVEELLVPFSQKLEAPRLNPLTVSSPRTYGPCFQDLCQ